MPERVETVVIGGGQAGLSTSCLLTERGREHVVLERGDVGNTWRTERWDGFHLNTPNWSLALPRFEYSGADPDAFAPTAGVIAYLDEYARSFSAPVRTGVEVTSLRRHGDGWLVETAADAIRATNVVVATGAFRRPHLPPVAASAGDDVFQLVATDYRNESQLPAGAVLVVGSGQTGCQIADELRRAGRTVYLSVGRCPWFPRRRRGRDLVFWLDVLGMLDDTVDSLPSPEARLACNPAASGDHGGHDCNPRWLARRGVVPVGRLERFEDGRALLGPDLATTLAQGDAFVRTFVERVDAYVREQRLDLPEPEPDEPVVGVDSFTELDLGTHDVTTVVWATGYRPGFDWVEVPVFDEHGWPLQRRGVTDARGLYFVGVHWMHKRKSALLLGVGEDAEHVVSHLDAAA